MLNALLICGDFDTCFQETPRITRGEGGQGEGALEYTRMDVWDDRTFYSNPNHHWCDHKWVKLCNSKVHISKNLQVLLV